MHKTFNTRERQLNPLDVITIAQQFYEGIRGAWRAPYQSLRIGERNNLAAARNDRIGHP